MSDSVRIDVGRTELDNAELDRLMESPGQT